MRLVALALSWCVLVIAPSPVFGQTSRPAPPDTVVVATAAPIFLYPDDQRIPLRTAAVNTVLQVIGVDGDWYNVRFQDPEYGPRVGYIQKKFLKTPDLRPMDLSVKTVTPPSTAEATTPVSAKLEGTPAAARPIDQPDERALRRPDGGWFNIGLGIGSAGCQDCFDRQTGLSGGLSFGGAINDKVWLGFGTTGWTKQIDFDRISIGTAVFLVRVYPAHRSGFFITAGAGVGSFQETEFDAQFGAGVVIGVGWDIPIGERVSLTPFYNGFAMQNDVIDGNVSQLGIGITIHRIR